MPFNSRLTILLIYLVKRLYVYYKEEERKKYFSVDIDGFKSEFMMC